METFVGDTITINVNAGIDLSTYDNLVIKFKRPNGTTGIWNATLDPLDSTHMYYITDETNLNMSGTWILQAHADEVGVSLHGLWTELVVHDPLPETTVVPTTFLSPGPTTTP